MRVMQWRIAVLGAGVVGLSAAVQIQAALPQAEVTIIADKFCKDTTSYVAAGLVRPSLTKTPGVPVDVVKQWLHDSWEHYIDILHSPDAGQAGVQMISGYRFVNNPEKNPLEEDLLFTNRRLTTDELNIFPGIARKFKYGWFVTSFLADPKYYLPYLMQKFLACGGRVEKRHISTLDQLVSHYDLVANCCGNGSKDLLPDPTMTPIRGHILKVDAPWIKHSIHVGDDGNCYVIPGRDHVTVGGTRQVNDLKPTPRQCDKDKILSEACQLIPSLKNAKILEENVGFRPHREPLRVEAEVYRGPTGAIKVVHNYGHGAEGVTLSWGTSKEATRLVIQSLHSAKL